MSIGHISFETRSWLGSAHAGIKFEKNHLGLVSAVLSGDFSADDIPLAEEDYADLDLLSTLAETDPSLFEIAPMTTLNIKCAKENAFAVLELFTFEGKFRDSEKSPSSNYLWSIDSTEQEYLATLKEKAPYTESHLEEVQRVRGYKDIYVEVNGEKWIVVDGKHQQIAIPSGLNSHVDFTIFAECIWLDASERNLPYVLQDENIFNLRSKSFKSRLGCFKSKEYLKYFVIDIFDGSKEWSLFARDESENHEGVINSWVSHLREISGEVDERFVSFDISVILDDFLNKAIDLQVVKYDFVNFDPNRGYFDSPGVFGIRRLNL